MELKIDFGVVGRDLNPRTITKLLGVNPSRSRIRGDEYEGKTLVAPGKVEPVTRKYSSGSWVISWSSVEDDCELNELSDNVFRLIEPQAEKVEELVKDESLRVFIRITFSRPDGSGGLFLDQDRIVKFGRLCNDMNFTFLCESEHVD